MINRIESATQRSSDAPVAPPVGSGFDTRLSLEASTSAALDGAARVSVDDGPGGSGAVLQLDSRGRIICQCQSAWQLGQPMQRRDRRRSRRVLL